MKAVEHGKQSANGDGIHMEEVVPFLGPGGADSPERGAPADGGRPRRRVADVGEEFAVDDAVEAVGMGRFQALLLLVVGTCVAGKGATITLGAFIFPGAKCDFNLTHSQESKLTVWVFIGVTVGSFVWGLIGDMAGRRISIVVATLGGIVMSCAATLAPNIQWLSASLLILGFTMAGQLTDLAYLLEYTPAAYRGKFALALGLAWAIGTTGDAALAWLIMPAYGWRALVVVTNIPYAIAVLLLLLVPESARYLIVKGRQDDARKALDRMARMNGAVLPRDAQLVSPAIKSGNKKLSLNGLFEKSISSLSKMFDCSSLRMSVLVMHIWVVGGFIYTTMLLMNTEVHASKSSCTGDHTMPLHLSDRNYREILIVSCADLVGQFLPLLIIDRLGRQWSMFALFLGAFASMLPILVARPDPTASLFGIRAFAQSVQLVVGVYTSEAYPTDIRAFALGMGHTISSIGSIGVPLVAQGVLHKYGIRASIGVLVALLATGAAAAVGLPIDTTGKPLEDTVDEGGRRKSKAHDQQSEQLRCVSISSSKAK